MSGEENKILKKLICAGIVTLVLAGCARANLVDSNSVVEDGIEHYIQTNKSIYDLGEDVEMLYRVTNLGDEIVEFIFNNRPLYDRSDYMVEKDGERIWDNLGRRSQPAGCSFTLNPLESYEFSHIWDMFVLNESKTDYIPLTETGTYDIIGVLDYGPDHERYVPVSVSIEIIPEPSTLVLLGIGLVGLLAYRKKK